MSDFRNLMELIGTGVDAVGVVTVVVGALFATGRFAFGLQGKPDRSYRRYRQDLGRAILLGLEFLVAGDIFERSWWRRRWKM